MTSKKYPIQLPVYTLPKESEDQNKKQAEVHFASLFITEKNEKYKVIGKANTMRMHDNLIRLTDNYRGAVP